jgi:type IV fimbrial biogenesis protein FimT
MSAMQSNHSQSAPARRTRGFTMIEMMVTVAVLAVIMMVAAPSLAGFVRSSKVRSAQSEMIASLMLARSEAAKRGMTVGLAASAPTSGNEFGNGWTVWVDTNEDGVVDSGELVLRTYPSLNAAVVLGTTRNITTLAFNSSGFLTPSTAVNFKACGGNSDTTKGFAIRVDPVGLADIQEAACP